MKNSKSSRYGLEKTDEMEIRNREAYQKALTYREENKSKIPSITWKRVPNGECPGAKYMCSYLAEKASNSWNKLDIKTQKQNLGFILDLDDNLNTNADGIIFYNKKNKKIEKIFMWKLKIDISNYLQTVSDGIYIYHGTIDDYILKTQVKYNNGIIEGMYRNKDPKDWNIKPSKSYLSSWNYNADLKKIFDLKEFSIT